jgi:prepilin-type N-terminal cleavage/methylation domain-containing protein
MKQAKGFTLIEISIVLVIIALILGTVLVRSDILIGSAKANSTVSLLKDLTGALSEFKSRYHYLPGDLPSASTEFPAIVAGTECDKGNGNGLINDVTTPEIKCVAEHLVQAGLIKGDKRGNALNGIYSPYSFATNPDVLVLTNSVSQTIGTIYKFGNATLPPVQVLHVIEISGIPCDDAKAIDRKIDNDDLASGNIRASIAACVSTDFVTIDIAL